jgi:hypothetical protein
MKKQISILILLIITVIQIHAQKTRDVLYLKDGSIIYGTLIEINENQYKIRTFDGSLFIFETARVEKFVREDPVSEGRKKEGIGISLEGGLLIGTPNSTYPSPFSFNVIGNYTVGSVNILGFGSGVEFIGQSYSPLFIEYKRLLTIRTASPFLFVRTGVLMHLGEGQETIDNYYPQYNYHKNYTGGPTFTIGTGISWVRESMETYLSFAYRYTTTSYIESDYNNYETTYRNSYNRLEIKFGFKF